MLSKSSLTLSDGRIYFEIPNDKENESKIKATYTRINKWFSTYSHELSLDCVWLKKPFVANVNSCPTPSDGQLVDCSNNSNKAYIAISIRIINARASTNQWNRLICNDRFDTWNGIATIQASRKNHFIQFGYIIQTWFHSFPV